LRDMVPTGVMMLLVSAAGAQLTVNRNASHCAPQCPPQCAEHWLDVQYRSDVARADTDRHGAAVYRRGFEHKTSGSNHREQEPFAPHNAPHSTAHLRENQSRSDVSRAHSVRRGAAVYGRGSVHNASGSNLREHVLFAHPGALRGNLQIDFFNAFVMSNLSLSDEHEKGCAWCSLRRSAQVAALKLRRCVEGAAWARPWQTTRVDFTFWMLLVAGAFVVLALLSMKYAT
jgi:hypothetical protein